MILLLSVFSSTISSGLTRWILFQSCLFELLIYIFRLSNRESVVSSHPEFPSVILTLPKTLLEVFLCNFLKNWVESLLVERLTWESNIFEDDLIWLGFSSLYPAPAAKVLFDKMEPELVLLLFLAWVNDCKLLLMCSLEAAYYIYGCVSGCWWITFKLLRIDELLLLFKFC